MQSSHLEQTLKLSKCNCCLNPIQCFPNSLDHQNSGNITHSSTFHYDFATATTSSLYPNTQFTNPNSLPTLPESFQSFTLSFPQYLTTVEADQFRSEEYRHLSLHAHVCLDYSGHSLFSSSQTYLYHHQQQQHELEFVASSSSTVPQSKPPRLDSSHKERESLSLSSSSSSSSSSLSKFEAKLKGRIMSYLNVSEDDYSVYFTPNQTSAFKVLADSYPFQSNKNLTTVYDHENEAVEAMVECSRNRGARIFSAEFKWPKLKIHGTKLEKMILGSSKNKTAIKKKKKKKNRGLFVFPIQSRVSGARYSYQWMSLARENGWHVLLDATSLTPKEMDTLGLSLFQPDFLISTFYKVFGDDPSGFACLLVRNSISPILNHNSSHIWSARGISGLNISTDTYQGVRGDTEIQCKGLDHADMLGLVLIGNRVRCLINWLLNALLALYHPHNSDTGLQLVQVYGPRVKFNRGSSIAFNIYDWKGDTVEPALVQKIADRNNVSVGCGMIKHVWFHDSYQIERQAILGKENNNNNNNNNNKGKRRECSENGITVVTVNVGFLTNFEDVYRMWKFVAKFLDADFVEKERWRYKALNQKLIQV